MSTTQDNPSDQNTMPLIAHLSQLRICIRNIAISFVLGFALTFTFKETIYLWIATPLLDAWKTHQALTPELGNASLHFGSLLEPLWTYLSLALWSALFLSLPWIFYQFWRFIAPGLYRKEKLLAVVFSISSSSLFVLGSAFCYFWVLPTAFDFFLDYWNSNLATMSSTLNVDPQATLALRPTLFMHDYLRMTLKLLLGFGIVFELPLVLIFLAATNIITYRHLLRFNRWAILLSFLIAAVVTPPDVISQILMAIPLVGLYNLSIGIAWIIARKKRPTSD